MSQKINVWKHFKSPILLVYLLSILFLSKTFQNLDICYKCDAYITYRGYLLSVIYTSCEYLSTFEIDIFS